MKKIFMLLMMVSAVMVMSSCSSDDDDEIGGSSLLIGVWDCIKCVDFYDGDTYEYECEDSYVEFTASKMKIHDEDDIASDTWISYTYNSKTGVISISGWDLWTVEKLTSSELIIKAGTDDDYSRYTYKKRK